MAAAKPIKISAGAWKRTAIVVREAEREARRSRDESADGRKPGPLTFIGLITTAGPAAEADFADSRYWIKRARIVNETAGDDELEIEAIPTDDPAAEIVCAVNLAEAVTHSHGTPQDTPVIVYHAYDYGDPPQRRYYFGAGGGDSFVDAVITGATEIGAGRWRYTCKRIELEPDDDDADEGDDDHGNWQIVPDAATLAPCYNRAELVIAGVTGASPSTTHGTGTIFAQIADTGYAIAFIPVGVPVLLRPRGDGTYWFTQANTVTGGCPRLEA